ncbi:MAG: hypothetical protein U5L09_11520 [Bacteroidales bacterium]|nr:hypothetical protein [Bacteroidales bacterium]
MVADHDHIYDELAFANASRNSRRKVMDELCGSRTYHHVVELSEAPYTRLLRRRSPQSSSCRLKRLPRIAGRRIRPRSTDFEDDFGNNYEDRLRGYISEPR